MGVNDLFDFILFYGNWVGLCNKWGVFKVRVAFNGTDGVIGHSVRINEMNREINLGSVKNENGGGDYRINRVRKRVKNAGRVR